MLCSIEIICHCAVYTHPHFNDCELYTRRAIAVKGQLKALRFLVVNELVLLILSIYILNNGYIDTTSHMARIRRALEHQFDGRYRLDRTGERSASKFSSYHLVVSLLISFGI